MDHLVNQENMPRVSRAAGKAVVQQQQQLPQQHRAVLGQIQNVGRSRPINQQPVKAVKSQVNKYIFIIGKLTLNIPAYLPPYSCRGWTDLSTNCIGTMSALKKKMLSKHSFY